jgi:hypothetical protein
MSQTNRRKTMFNPEFHAASRCEILFHPTSAAHAREKIRREEQA